MPVRPCHHPTCPALVRSGRWCDAHKHLEKTAERAAEQKHYDQHRRDPEAKAFYRSAA